MQQKGLFAAILCGALCLTGCLKNVESDSVTEVRKGHAQKLIAEAKLAEAQGQAELIRANAEATLKAAQAELAKAEADREKANAALIQAQADLALVNVEIAKIKLEEERVVLQAKKAELEALIAKYEADIVKAQASKQYWTNQLEKAKLQAEIDKVNLAKELAEAQNDLLEEASNLDKAEAFALTRALINYTNAISALNKAQVDLINKQVDLAQMEAGIQDGIDIMEAELEEAEDDLADLQYEYEYILSIAITSYEEFIAAYNEISEKLRPAYETYQAALDARMEAWNDYQAIEDAADRIEFINNWGSNPLQAFAAKVLGDDLTVFYDEDNTEITGYYDDNYLFVPLWSDENYVGHSEVYPQPVNGVMPAYSKRVYQYEEIPATIVYDNFTAILDNATEEMEEEWAEYQEGWQTRKHSAERNVEYYQGIVDAEAAYVAEADAKLEPAKKAMDDAEKAKDLAYEAYVSSFYRIQNYNSASTVWAHYMSAYSQYDQAVDNDITAEGTLNRAENSVAIAVSRVNIAKDEKYEADKAVANKTAEVATLKKAVTDAIVKAYEDAKTAVETQEGVVKTAEKAIETTRDAERAAEIAYLANPDDTALKTAYETAKTNAATAVETYNTENAKLPDLRNTLDEKKAAYDAVNDPYEAAQEELKVLEEIASNKADQLAEAETAFAEAEATLVEAKAAKENAETALEAAKTAKEAAYEAWLASNDDPALLALVEACDKAYEEYKTARQTWRTARYDYYTIYYAYNDIDYWNFDYYDDASWTYDNYVSDLDPENEGSSAYWLEYYQTNIEFMDFMYAYYEEQVAEFHAEVEAIKAIIAHYQEIEPVYTEWFATYQAAEDKYYVETEKAVIDAMIPVYELQAQLNALNKCVFAAEDGSWNFYTLEEIIEYILPGYEEKIAELQKKIDEIEAAIIKSYISPTFNLKAKAQLEADIAALQEKIKVYTALVEKYEAQIDALSGSVE